MASASDGRAPGKKWVRTKLGWKPLKELNNKLDVQPLHLPREEIGELDSQVTVTATAASKNSFVQRKLKLSHHPLYMRCVPAGIGTSKESSRYSTISDAVQKLNFQSALNDENCFFFICKVLCFIFDDIYNSSSGSLQISLLRLVESATQTSISNNMLTYLVAQTIDKAISANEKVRLNQISTFSLGYIDSRIKSLMVLKQKLQDFERNCSDIISGINLLDLPDDCLIHIMWYLSNPRDILNLQLTCYRLSELCTDNTIWKSLTYFHYEEDICEDLVEKTSWMDTFVVHYITLEKKLKHGNSSSAIVLCKICKFAFWADYGHPCCEDSLEASALVGNCTTKNVTPQDFISLFYY